MILIELLRDAAKKFSLHTAWVYRGQSTSYAQAMEQSLALAAGFEARGVGANDKILLLAKNSPEFALTIFAATRLRAVVVPVNFYLKAEEVTTIARHCEAKAIVTQQAFLDVALETQKNSPQISHVWVCDSTDEKSLQNLFLHGKTPQAPEPSDSATAILLYTSGTTGQPKGVMLSHQNLTTNALASIEGLGLKSSDRFLCLLPMFHVFAWTANILVPLAMGSPIVLVESIRPPKPWLKLLREHRVTVFAAVPQIFHLLAEQATGLKRWALRWLFFRSVRFCISGAAPLSIETQDLFESRLGCKILQGYGLTETSPVTNANRIHKRKRGSVGPTIPGVEMQIRGDNEAIMPAGEEGEICFRGPNIMQGYYKDETATRAAFTQDGWFKTGDVGLIDRDGYLFIRDRIKDMIIIKGLKVFSIQVEQLLNSHPAVLESAVIGVPDASGDETIHAFVVLREGASVEAAELQKFCREKLPPYKCPKQIRFLKELPKNALQKVLKRELRKL